MALRRAQHRGRTRQRWNRRQPICLWTVRASTGLHGCRWVHVPTRHRPVGSVRLVVDASTGVIAQRLDYDAWRRVLVDTNPGFQPFGFAGGHDDPDTGLVRFGARDYDAEVGRWTTKDPIGLAGGVNVYAYAANDPVNMVDWSGRAPEPVPSPPEPSPTGAANGPGPANVGPAPRPSTQPKPSARPGGPIAVCRAHPLLCGFALGFCLGCPACCELGDSPDSGDGPVCEWPSGPTSSDPEKHPYREPAPGDDGMRKTVSQHRGARPVRRPRHLRGLLGVPGEVLSLRTHSVGPLLS